MSASRAARAYVALLRLYPRTFRNEYGADMVQLLEDQLRDERPARVVARTAVDLVISIPTRHLEAHMQRPAAPIVPVLFTAVSVASLVAALVLGVGPGFASTALAVSVVSAAIAALAWRRARPVAAETSTLWWKILAAGTTLLTGLIVTVNITGELPDGWWLVAMLTGLFALALMGTGAILGLTRVGTHRPSAT